MFARFIVWLWLCLFPLSSVACREMPWCRVSNAQHPVLTDPKSRSKSGPRRFLKKLRVLPLVLAPSGAHVPGRRACTSRACASALNMGIKRTARRGTSGGRSTLLTSFSLDDLSGVISRPCFVPCLVGFLVGVCALDAHHKAQSRIGSFDLSRSKALVGSTGPERSSTKSTAAFD